jgi:hypothetical protein
MWATARAAADKCIGPSARKKRGPQDDNGLKSFNNGSITGGNEKYSHQNKSVTCAASFPVIKLTY